jgi:GNAT superfamily N-acetyltransferase
MFTIRPLTDADRPWARQWMIDHWGAELVIVHGEQLYPAEYPGFVAETGADAVGLVTYALRGAECEILSLDSLIEGQGIGSALIESVRMVAHGNGARRLWLITTNDNITALRFYQKRGFELVKIHRRAIDESRKLKPSIPLIGDFDIPIRDEIEMEMFFGVESLQIFDSPTSGDVGLR